MNRRKLIHMRINSHLLYKCSGQLIRLKRHKLLLFFIFSIILSIHLTIANTEALQETNNLESIAQTLFNSPYTRIGCLLSSSVAITPKQSSSSSTKNTKLFQRRYVLFLSGEEMGEGKTERALKEIAEIIRKDPDCKILFLVPNHKLAEEIVERLAKKRVFAKHIEGWVRKCPKFLAGNKRVVKLYDKDGRDKNRDNPFYQPLSTPQICKLSCTEKEYKNCIYHKQFCFEKGSVVVGVQAFIRTPIIKAGWNHIYVDDTDIFSAKTLPSLQDLEEIFQILLLRYAHKLAIKLNIIAKPFYKLSKMDYYKIQNEIDDKSYDFYNSLVDDKKLTDWLFNNTDRLKKYRFILINPDFDAFQYYRRVHSIYKWDIPQTAYLEIFTLLFNIKNTKITLIGRQTEAREFLLKKMLKKYEKEFGELVELKDLPKLHYKDKPAKGFLHQVTRGRAPRSTLSWDDRKRTRDIQDAVLKSYISLLRKNGKIIKQIGVITYKNYGKINWLIKTYPRTFKEIKLDDILTFGKLRGIDSFSEKVDLVLILGTYTINHKDLVRNHNLIFLEKAQQLDYGMTLGSPKTGLYYDVDKYPTLENLRQYREWDEMTQAIGRSVMRGIDTVIIGDVPEFFVSELGDNYQKLKAVRNTKKKGIHYKIPYSFPHKIMEFLFDHYSRNGLINNSLREIHSLLLKEGIYVKSSFPRFSLDFQQWVLRDRWFTIIKKKVATQGKVGAPVPYLTWRNAT